MGKYHIIFEILAQKQIILHYKNGDKATLKNTRRITLKSQGWHWKTRAIKTWAYWILVTAG